MTGEEVERIVKQAEKIGWCNYFDTGLGWQPAGRYVGDRLGPLPRRAMTHTAEERDRR